MLTIFLAKTTRGLQSITTTFCSVTRKQSLAYYGYVSSPSNRKHTQYKTFAVQIHTTVTLQDEVAYKSDNIRMMNISDLSMAKQPTGPTDNNDSALA